MKNKVTKPWRHSIPNELNWETMRTIAREHKPQLISAHIIAILATLASVPIPLLMPMLVDEVLLEQPGVVVNTINTVFPLNWQSPILYIGTILIVTLVLRVVTITLNVWQAQKFTCIAKDIIFRMRSALLFRLQTISMAAYETLGSGKVATHLVTDLETIDLFMGTTISRLLVAALSILGTAVVLLWMHWQLALFILILNPIVIYFTVSLGKQVKELKKNENTAFEIFQATLIETLDAIHQIRASNREQFYIHKLLESAHAVKQHAVSFSWRSDTANRLSFLVFLFGFDIFRAIAMIMVISSGLTIGEMLAVFGYLWFMMSPVQEILGIQYAYYGAKAALKRINDIQNLPQEPIYTKKINPFTRKHTVAVKLENLHFSYDNQSDVLNGINMEIPEGSKVALVGASGGGKSTLVQVLIGLYPATSGQILFDGIPVTDIGLDIVRENVATVLQHPVLFNDSIHNNLTMGKNHSKQKLWDALAIAQLDDTVRSCNKGLDTIVGRSGMRLSGGQRQRLAIARMILSEPKVVILDEATSALDTDTEHRLHHQLGKFLSNRTTIIIAHRLSAVKQANQVFVFEDGRICEQGEHNTLMGQNGLYAKLYGKRQQYTENN